VTRKDGGEGVTTVCGVVVAFLVVGWCNCSSPCPVEAAHAEDTTGKAGVLLKMHFENFLCHASFEVQFGSRVTFLNGENGSGKSAIVNGLQVCVLSKSREQHLLLF
jgi:AAA domain-containing protein